MDDQVDLQGVYLDLEHLAICGRYDALVVAVAREAQAALRKQIPVEPIEDRLAGGTYSIYRCGACKAWLRTNDKYCGSCGRRIKRDG